MIWVVAYFVIGGTLSLFVYESGIGFRAESAIEAEAREKGDAEKLENFKSHRLRIRWTVVLTILATWPVILLTCLLPGDEP